MTIAINNKLMKECKAVFASLVIISMIFGFLAPLAPTAESALVPGGTVGPVITAGVGKGFPAWYMDQNGLALEVMEAADGFGISDPVNPANNFSQELGFNAEGFYWSADASPTNPHGIGIAVLALEAAFAGEEAIDGEQSVFGRIRFRFDVGEPGTYTILHPFGTNTYVVDTVLLGAPEINDSSDIGCFATLGILSCDPNNPTGNPNNFSLALQSGIGPFLTWDTFNINPALSDPALVNAANPTKRYIGNPNVPHAITGSPVGQNFVRVEGPNIGGPGINFIQENLFAVAGRIAVVDVAPPVVVSVTPAEIAVDALGQVPANTVLSANITDDLGVRAATIDLGALGNDLTATLNGAQEVPATASAAAGDGTFTINTTANTLSFNITYSGLQGGVETAAHIHGPAAAGAIATPVFDLPLGASKVGVWTYPENLEADILAGNAYVNIHSALFPNGEIRGQILPVSNVQNMILTTGTNTNGVWSVILPNISRLGTFVLPISVSDGGNVTNLNFSLLITNPAPIANADAAIIGQGEFADIEVLFNDTDPNGNLPLSLESVQNISTGTAAVAPDGLHVVLTPPLSFTGTVTAQYTVADSLGATSTGDIAVTVTPALASIVITPATGSILTGGTQQLSAAASDQLGNPIVPTPTFVWTSSDPTVATVDANGLVTGVAVGLATINATSGDVSGAAIITIALADPVFTAVSATPASASIIIDATQQLTASAIDQFNNPMVPQPAIAWTSSDPTVATVDASGLVTGIAAGSATITATSGLLTGTAVLTVTDVPQVLTSIAINPATVSVVTGAAAQLSASALDQFGSPMVPQPAIAWTSSDPTVATVDASGLVTGIAIGSATITAASGAISGASSITVTLAPPVLTTISVSPAAASVNLGGTYKFTASVLDQFGLPFVATTIWASSNPAVGTVDANGLFTAVSAGETTITATSGSISGSAIATVGAPSSILSVTQIAAIKTFATADDTYANGWKWVFNATVPDNETKLAMKFSDWVSGGNAIAAASNIRIFSTQSSDANSETTAIAMTSAGAYSANMTLNGDMDAGVLGRQIQITIEVKIPAGSASGSYSTSYGIQTLQ